MAQHLEYLDAALDAQFDRCSQASIALAVSIVTAATNAAGLTNMAGELGRFPPPAVVAQYREMATGHLDWLEGQFGRKSDWWRQQ